MLSHSFQGIIKHTALTYKRHAITTVALRLSVFLVQDREAIKQVSLHGLVESLPGFYCAIADCAYTPTEHMVPIFPAQHAALTKNDNFNFFCQPITN
jgi:hypothetical protein